MKRPAFTTPALVDVLHQQARCPFKRTNLDPLLNKKQTL